MKACLLLPVLALSAFAGAQSTPDEALRQMVLGWNRRDLKFAATAVYGTKPNTDYSSVLKLGTGAGWPKIEVRDVQTSASRGLATMTYTVIINAGTRPDTRKESLQARQVGGVWKIVPNAANPTRLVLPMVAQMLVNPNTMLQGAKKAATATASLSNLKQLALACIMLSADENDRFAFTPANARKRLTPYLRNEALWTAPGDPKGTISYSVNPAIAGKSMTAIPNPAEVVLMYQGKNGKIDFKYDGRAPVAFADGHVKMLNRQQAAKLDWKP